jgi:hypothetical protein
MSDETLRDSGAQMALEHAGELWGDGAQRLAIEFYRKAGDAGALAEGARQHAVERGLGAPPSPNAWGAVTLGLVRKKVIVRTGRWDKSTDSRSHARMQPLWRLA